MNNSKIKIEEDSSSSSPKVKQRKMDDSANTEVYDFNSDLPDPDFDLAKDFKSEMCYQPHAAATLQYYEQTENNLVSPISMGYINRSYQNQQKLRSGAAKGGRLLNLNDGLSYNNKNKQNPNLRRTQSHASPNSTATYADVSSTTFRMSSKRKSAEEIIEEIQNDTDLEVTMRMDTDLDKPVNSAGTGSANVPTVPSPRRNDQKQEKKIGDNNRDKAQRRFFPHRSKLSQQTQNSQKQTEKKVANKAQPGSPVLFSTSGEETEPEDYSRNIQLTTNMDKFTINLYIDWLGKYYSRETSRRPHLDILSIFHGTLSKEEVFRKMDIKIREIRSNQRLMENKTLPQLYRMVSAVVIEVVEADLRDTRNAYNSFLNILKGPDGRRP